jgi:lysozyme family protein
MADFAAAIEIVLSHEGGFVDHSSDPGGATRWGVSLRWLARQDKLGDFDDDGDVDVDDIRAMTLEQAAEIYRTHWWERYRYGEIRDQEIATKVFDLAVNMGPKQCTLLAQDTCKRLDQFVVSDGIMGPSTRTAINKLKPHWFMTEFRVRAADFYRLLAHRDQGRRVFLHGWLNRAYA